ncbi:translation elongation factor EF-1 alpha [Perkinsus chesapeaki]|uniref:Translation elongation factor EF-1 alpha n=1 Tax=Perkinsus chesapeaki TaxID=330153 RepID=A0A7J6MZI4_PERCH|nr:translation elongation factor EF-1 alpha [Perkinsus chesapeaki]
MTIDGTTIKRNPMNVAFMGHHRAGKSTAAGHLLTLCGAKKAEKVRQCRDKAERASVPDLRYAWLLDKLKVEQEKRMTVNTNLDYFQTRKYRYTLLDCPGHKDYLRNTIVGASQADVCVLVVSAVPDEFDEGMSQLGETREHALVAYVSGVRRMIVAVNKMDRPEVAYSKEQFHQVSTQIQRYLRNLGFDDNRVEMLPISALTGYNIYNRGPSDPSGESPMAWYKGPSLWEHLDLVSSPHRKEAEGPFRMPIADIHRLSSGSSSDTSLTDPVQCSQKTAVILAGEITSGTVEVGDQVRVVPGGIEATVASIQTGNGVSERRASAGDNIGIKIEGVTSKEVRRGQVLSCIGDAAVGEYKRVDAQVVLVNFPGELRPGYSPVIDIGTASSTVQFKSLKKRLHRTTGVTLEEEPDVLVQGDGAIVELAMSKAMACCTFQPSRSVLGRFTIRDRKTVIAVGTILQTWASLSMSSSSGYVRGRSRAFGQLMGARHYCKICNCWCALHPNAIKTHERSERHLANVEREIRRQRQSEVETKRDQAEVSKQIARMNAAAASSMERDAGLFDPRRRVTELAEPDIQRLAALNPTVGAISSVTVPLPEEQDQVEEPAKPSCPPPLLPPLPLALQRLPPLGAVPMPPPAKPATPAPQPTPPQPPKPAMFIPAMPRPTIQLNVPPKPASKAAKVEEEPEVPKEPEYIQKDDVKPSSELMSLWDETKVAAARANTSQQPKIDANTGLGMWQAVDAGQSAFGDSVDPRKKKSHTWTDEPVPDESAFPGEGSTSLNKEDTDGHGQYNEDELFLGDLAKSSRFLAESEECGEERREVLAVDVSSTVGNKHATSVSTTFGASRHQKDRGNKRRRRRTDDD